MNMLELVEVAGDEGRAQEYLRGVGLLRTIRDCPGCGSEVSPELSRSRMRCRGRECRRDVSVRHGSLLSGSRISCSRFLLVLWNFVDEKPALSCAKTLELNRNTVNRYYRLFRLALSRDAGTDFPAEAESGAEDGRTPVFGIAERGGRVAVDFVPGLHAETLLSEEVRTVRRGSLICTDRFRSYDGMISYGFRSERIVRSRRFDRGRVHIDGSDGFWSFARERLQRLHGVSAEHFPLHLREMEVRYNRRGDDLFGIVIENLGGLEPGSLH